MSRINTNVNSLIANRILNQQNAALNKSLERLSTGLRINRGGDDPAGLIASEALRSEKAAISAAISNAERADQIVNVAEGGLQEINSLLIEVQSLVSQNANEAGLSTQEKEANQQQVDAILQTIDRIASTTSFQGVKLLNGSFDFTVSSVGANVADFQINGAKLGANNIDVQATITQSAQRAGLFLSLDAAALDLDDATSSFSFELAGTLGNRSFSFASGSTLANIATEINSFTDSTGVNATVSGTGLFLKSEDFGSDQFVSVDITNDAGQSGNVTLLSSTDENVASTVAANNTALASVNSPIRDEGQDINAVINGVVARGQGIRASIATDALDLEVEFGAAAYTATGSQTLFTLTGGGAQFQLGPEVNINNQVTLGIGNVAARSLGTTTVTGDVKASLDALGSGKLLNLIDGNLGDAQDVVNNAINDVSKLRGRLGSFQSNVVGSTINALSVAFENISAAESSIRDTDFAAETAELTRSQILVAAAGNVLQISNSQPQSVLGLIG